MSPLSPLQRATAANHTYQAEQLARLERAKKESKKELFEIEKFKALYDLHDDRGEYHVSPEHVLDLEIEYYLASSEIMTLQAFADHRRRRDAEQAG